MARWLHLPTVLVLLVLWGQPAAAISPTPEEVISSSLTRCEARIQAHLAQADSTRRTSNVLLILGAVIAVLGNAAAPFLKKAPHRKATAVLGALGAVLAVVPKTLDEPATFKTLHDNAERHRDVAVKVERQISFITEPEAKAALKKYVIARLADCESGSPSPQPPSPPEVAGIAVAISDRNDAMSAPGVSSIPWPIREGETFTLDDGSTPPLVFEFTFDEQGVNDAAARDARVPDGKPVSVKARIDRIRLEGRWYSIEDIKRALQKP